MAITMANAAEVLLLRVRGTGGYAHTAAEAKELLAIAQHTINLGMKRVIESDTLTTLAYQQIYSIPDNLPDAQLVVSVQDAAGADMDRVTLPELSAYDNTWHRRAGTTNPKTWTQIGRELLVIYPAKTTDSTVTVEYVKSLYSTTADIALEDDDLEMMYVLAEALILLKQKKFAEVETRVAFLEEHAGIRIGRNAIERRPS